jgi:hypothetical protein
VLAVGHDLAQPRLERVERGAEAVVLGTLDRGADAKGDAVVGDAAKG